MTEENLSPEEQAEEIFNEVMGKVDANGDDCPLGEKCSIHFRVDEETINNDAEFGRLITYVGEYMIMTTDNPDIQDPRMILKILTGKLDDLPQVYETCVMRVGDGALADIRSLDAEGRRDALRFVQKHDSWENFKNAHEAVVQAVKDGLIDLSTPVQE